VPHSGDSAQEVLRKLLTERPRPLLPEVPSDLAAIVAKAMLPDRDERYANAAELAADLRRFQLGQRVSAVSAGTAYDPAIEAAFAEELELRSNAALRILGVVSFFAVGSFAFIPVLQHGAFVARDLLPRGVTCLGFVLITAAARLRRASQALSVALLLLMTCFFVVVDVLEHNVIDWFTPSAIAAFLGASAILPLTPAHMLWVVIPLSLAAPLEGFLSGMSPTSVPFLLQTSMVSASGLVTYIGSRLAHRTRRAEFYNRHRLQSANERLAKLERR
jgi:hypothetical protein